MDFGDSPEEAAFRAEVRAWLGANAKPRRASDVPQVFLSEALDVETVRAAQAWQRRKAEAGWACLRWAKAYGGREATPIQSVIWGQEESKFQTSPDVYGIGIGMCGPTLLTHADKGMAFREIPSGPR
jgi:acyl-CoA dehydrogenase